MFLGEFVNTDGERVVYNPNHLVNIKEYDHETWDVTFICGEGSLVDKRNRDKIEREFRTLTLHEHK